MTVDLVVKNAIVVTCDEEQTVIQNGGVAVSNGRITQIGESAALEQAAGSARITWSRDASIRTVHFEGFGS